MVLVLICGVLDIGSHRLQNYWFSTYLVFYMAAVFLFDWLEPLFKAVSLGDYGYAVGFSLGAALALAIISFLVTIILLAFRKLVKAVDSDD